MAGSLAPGEGTDITANLQFAPSSAPLRTIQEVQFGLLSPEEIKAMSVVHIEYPETMDEQRQGPREKGLSDPKLGTIDKASVCATCFEGERDCPGHFGHIELASPVFHVGFVNKIKKLLETVCHNCGKILLDESNPQFAAAAATRDPKRRFDKLHKLCKPRMICEADPPEDPNEDIPQKDLKRPSHGGCGNQQPEIRKEGLRLMGTWKIRKSEEEEDRRQPEKRAITPEETLNIFRRISVEDIAKLGLSNDYARPEWMLVTVLPVPPPQVRPSIVVNGAGQGPRGEDDLTYKLGDIIRANANVRRCNLEGSPLHVKSEFEQLLQFHVATYMDNDIAGQPKALQKSGRPVKAIRARLKGKEGRLRGNLMGKRVDFSARTVITGDPNLSLDEVGVPRSIAKTLTYPEKVTPLNIDRLTRLVRNGAEEHPGARFVIRNTDGLKYDLRKVKNPPALQYGWKVERHIVDGDFIIFNRQPSLHKESMMGHRIRVMPYSTFRLNLSVTSPYNADFDGDEMNLHVPQSEETRAEIMNLCMVPLNIVSPQRNSPLMGIVQDTLCGIYKMCRRDVLLSQDQVMNILMWVPDWDGIMPPPAILKPRPRWTGKQLISMALPTGLNLQRGAVGSPLNDTDMLVSNGELMYGMFAKGQVGSAAGGVIHLIFNEKGPDAAVKFFNGAQTIVNYWLLHNGFSVGIGDTIPDSKTISEIEAAVNKKKGEVEDFTTQATSNKLKLLPGKTLRETFESQVTKSLNEARDKAGSLLQGSIKDNNNAVQMSRSGSKGSSINLAQMTATVGQQAVEGKRIPFGFKYRTLPHFTKDDYSPQARGFVENSYLRGLTPTEFFFHAMAGREGLIDTAVKTAETGYIQRRLVKALEDVQVKYDTTVRNSLGDIIQFTYGEDGLDAVYIEKQKIDSIACSNTGFDKMYRLDVLGTSAPLKERLEVSTEIAGDNEVQTLLDEEFAQLSEDRTNLRKNREKRVDPNSEIDMLQLPINISRMIEMAKVSFGIAQLQRSDLHPSYVINQVRELTAKLVVIRGDDPLSEEAQNSATLLVKAHIRAMLAFKRVVCDHRLNKLAFDNIVGDIESRFSRAFASPGEMVGVLAAQSIGEPATQMTLNTFHYAGVSSKNVTLGVPRLKEILNVAKNLKTPTMSVYLADPKMKTSTQAAMNLRPEVEHTTLRTICDATEIYYDPDISSTVIPADRDMVEAYFVIPDESEEELALQSKWLLRLVINRAKMLDKRLVPQDIAAKIKSLFGNDLAVIFSDENEANPVIRLRVNRRSTGKDDDIDEDELGSLQRTQEYMLDGVTLGGIPGIDKAVMDEVQFTYVDKDGSVKVANDDSGDPGIEASERGKEKYLVTSGTAFARVLELDGVDPKRTQTNRFDETMEVLGIEAAREILLRELVAVLSFDGSYVNHRHLSLLVDVMTWHGYLTPVTRHGINRNDTGALMRCSFEETVEILLDAAASGELDDCRGVSENIMLGQLAPVGTGEVEVLMDQEMLNTITADNAGRGYIAGVGPRPSEEGAATPYEIGSPMQEGGFASPDYGASFSPIVHSGQDSMGGGFSTYEGNDMAGGFSPWGGGGTSPAYGGVSPFSAGFSPASPGGYSPVSPGGGYSPSSPSMNISSPAFNPTSPAFGSPASPAMATPTSPAYSPASPAFNPTGGSPTSPHYSPTSPNYSPTSPNYSPASPNYSPASPSFSPTSPASGAPASNQYSPTSPRYSPTSPSPGQNTVSPTSPKYSPASPVGATYSPTSPQMHSPSSPAGGYSPTSPQWTPKSPQYSPASPPS